MNTASNAGPKFELSPVQLIAGCLAASGLLLAHVTGADFFWHEEADAGAGRRTGFEIR